MTLLLGVWLVLVLCLKKGWILPCYLCKFKCKYHQQFCTPIEALFIHGSPNTRQSL